MLKAEIGSVSNRVCMSLRQKILSSELRPGERMVEAKVAKELGVSITPVREAFSSLAKRGLLMTFPYCGSYVMILTQEAAEELVVVRQALETTAAKLAFSSLDPSDADHLEFLCRMADEKNAVNDRLSSIDYDIEFHEFFFKKANNALLFEMWSIMKDRVAFFQSITRPSCNAADPLVIDRHRNIIDAVRRMDLDALCQSMINHMTTTMQRAKLPSSDSITYK